MRPFSPLLGFPTSIKCCQVKKTNKKCNNLMKLKVQKSCWGNFFPSVWLIETLPQSIMISIQYAKKETLQRIKNLNQSPSRFNPWLIKPKWYNKSPNISNKNSKEKNPVILMKESKWVSERRKNLSKILLPETKTKSVTEKEAVANNQDLATKAIKAI